MTNQLKIAVLIYCENNCDNWSKAMREAGYGAKHAQRNAWSYLEKEDIKEEIQAFIDNRREKADFNREQSELELNLAQQRAITKGDVAAEISAIREKNTIFALRTENINTGDSADHSDLTPEQIERYKILAREMTKREHKPKTA